MTETLNRPHEPMYAAGHDSAPATPPSPGHDPDVDRTLAVLHRVLGAPAERGFDIRLWNGHVDVATGTPRADFSLAFTRRGALRRMLLPPSELTIAEALVSGDVEVHGPLISAVGLGDVIGDRINSVGAAAALLPLLLKLPRDGEQTALASSRYTRTPRALNPGGRRSEADEIRFHYDVGNDFYALWLDPHMLYTCAYYHTAHDDLATAQTAKLDHICRKLRLAPGERMLDIGCGWGGLVMHAAEKYGVHARGITLSAAQAEWAQRRIDERGLADRCQVDVMDVRDLPTDVHFHKMTSVGVTEHIPEAQQPEYFARAFAALLPGGLFMNHCEVSNLMARNRNTIGARFRAWLWKRDQFIDRYVFPDARLVPLGSVVTSAESAGFETRDIESLREHYALTLHAWLGNLQDRRTEALALVGERTLRVWELYMTVAARGFEVGAIGLAQVLLSKPTSAGDAGLPFTRDDIYAPRPG